MLQSLLYVHSQLVALPNTLHQQNINDQDLHYIIMNTSEKTCTKEHLKN